MNIENEEEEGNGDKFQSPGEVDTIKVTISRAAEKTACELVEKVNAGFEGGRVSRADLIGWVLTRFAESHTDVEIRSIRADHFDEIALLELCLKRSKQSGHLSPELRKLLLSQAGLDDIPKKPTKARLTN